VVEHTAARADVTAGSDPAGALAAWALTSTPTESDHELARRSLIDTLSVAAAAVDHRDARLAALLGPGGRLAALAHLVDYDDLHVPTTTHISAVCVTAAIAAGGGSHAYLAGAGVMARLGAMLGWRHYQAGWHATCTAGAPAAAVTAAVALGLDADALRAAIALAVPAAGGVNRAFGTSAKSLQVGFAVDAGVRAARLAAAGAVADPQALGQWLQLVGGEPVDVPAAPAIPGGLAIKIYPCCYALQRPIAAALAALDGECVSPGRVREVVVRAPLGTTRPLIHSRPRTGLQGKFSLEYGIAAAILDGHPGRGSFTDDAVRRPEAQRLLDLVRLDASPGGDDLLAGSSEVEIRLDGGASRVAALDTPPGAPGRPLTDEELARKARDCAGDDARGILHGDWESAAALAARWFER
jgi:2-methylcitrate dehydratase PrpD